MKVLWLCNIMLPRISVALNEKFNNIGGWLTGLSEGLIKKDNIELIILFPYSKLLSGTDKTVKYYSFLSCNPTKYNYEIKKRFAEIIHSEKPDIIHIFGTEYVHSLIMTDVCCENKLINKTIVSIQGLVSVCSKHYYAGLESKVINGYSLVEFKTGNNIKKAAKDFEKRGIYEIQTIKNVQHIIGRTDWDKACCKMINPNINYHFCNETLRSSFYKNEWKIDKIKKHSIFVSQCSYPIKGFHIMIKAMSEIIKYFPDSCLYTTGKDLINVSGINKLKLTYYQKYLRKLIFKYNLQNNVVFLGSLKEEQMCSQYLNSHVFASCSSIENSPNSVGEAMILGTPVVSSDVGGVKNMLIHNEEGYIYPFDEYYMLAYYIMKIFKNDDLALKLSGNARCHARKTHDEHTNTERLYQIYTTL